MKKIIITLISLVAFVTVSFAQTAAWETYGENNGVLIYTKTADCHMPSQGLHQQMILIKLVNTTDQAMQVDFDIKLWAMQECINCESLDEFHRSISLNAGESIEGSCDQLINSETGLEVFVQFLERDTRPPIVSRIELVNMNINLK